jgi:hypothetical protein
MLRLPAGADATRPAAADDDDDGTAATPCTDRGTDMGAVMSAPGGTWQGRGGRRWCAQKQFYGNNVPGFGQHENILKMFVSMWRTHEDGCMCFRWPLDTK